jgi:hypothetical protein
MHYLLMLKPGFIIINTKKTFLGCKVLLTVSSQLQAQLVKVKFKGLKCLPIIQVQIYNLICNKPRGFAAEIKLVDSFLYWPNYSIAEAANP